MFHINEQYCDMLYSDCQTQLHSRNIFISLICIHIFINSLIFVKSRSTEDQLGERRAFQSRLRALLTRGESDRLPPSGRRAGITFMWQGDLVLEMISQGIQHWTLLYPTHGCWERQQLLDLCMCVTYQAGYSSSWVLTFCTEQRVCIFSQHFLAFQILGVGAWP